MRRAFPEAVIVRPAVMFGSDDAFLATLVRLLRRLPLQPLFGRGQTRLQPVHVEDVAEAIARLLEHPSETVSTCYEFGGPRVYTYRELLEAIAREIGVRLQTVPAVLARVAELVPGGPDLASDRPHAAGHHRRGRPAGPAGAWRNADAARGDLARDRRPQPMTRKERRASESVLYQSPRTTPACC